MAIFLLDDILPDSFDERERQLAAFTHLQHADQKRKYTGAPYVVHLLAVAKTVKEYTDDAVLVATALCHDLFEDTSCSEQELMAKLHELAYSEESITRIVRYTWELTDRYTKKIHAHLSRGERKKLEAQRLVHIKACSATVKCADVLDNAPSIAKNDPSFAKVYVSEVMAFLPALEKGDARLFAKAMETCQNILAALPALTKQEKKKISKTLSLVLRHRPELFELQPDAHGWCKVDDVLKGFTNKSYFRLNHSMLEEVVATCNKQRFAFSEDKVFIRASQGHSIPVDLGYESRTPPPFLFHGTAEKYLMSILKEGLRKRKRHHVHLSSDVATATKVGSRHGSPVILKVMTAQMQDDGFNFYQSENGVWLVDHVPVEFLEVIEK